MDHVCRLCDVAGGGGARGADGRRGQRLVNRAGDLRVEPVESIGPGYTQAVTDDPLSPRPLETLKERSR